jgi:hypothetical protein
MEGEPRGVRLSSLRHACSELQRWPRFHLPAWFGSDSGVISLADRSALQYHRVQHGLLLAADLSRPRSDRAGAPFVMERDVRTHKE